MPGKDSHRHAASGAKVAAFVTPGRTTARRFGEEESFDAVLEREFGDCDLVLVEGYKDLPLPKIEVVRGGVPAPPVVAPAARVSDRPAGDSLPTHSFEDQDGILRTVLRLAGLERRAD